MECMHWMHDIWVGRVHFAGGGGGNSGFVGFKASFTGACVCLGILPVLAVFDSCQNEFDSCHVMVT